ncbi:hypothetical protein M9194_06185 [Vibrio sp. S4M6]|uniref:type VI secretion system protein IglI family protein n=1 Tax=Vibrio sinus TaxID=2946865 RepID=UPI002029BCD4|nr:type VI secretion system protein IglI family protein [Vibrio sinus]MCL9781012.1 hypothetical protein [Vibrio sinus]
MSVIFYQSFDDIVQVDKANPMLMSSIIRSFENGEYEKTQSLLEDYLYDTQTLDIYCLFLSFSCDVFLNVKNISELSARLEEYHDILSNRASVLSPKVNFDASLNSALDVLCNMLSVKFNEAKKQKPIFDFDALKLNFSRLFTQAACLNGEERNLTTHTGFREAQKSMMVLEQLRVEPESLEPEPEREPEPSVQTQARKKSNNNSNLVDKYASPKWYALIRKASILQKLLIEERHFEASIIYKDIQSEIKNFDPLVYFPGLFFPMMKSVAPKAQTLQAHIDKHQNTLEWDMANRLYQSDPMRFATELPLMAMNQYKDDQFYRSEEVQEPQPSYEQGPSMDDDYPEDDEFGEMPFNDDYRFDEGGHEMIPSEHGSEGEISDLVNDIDAMADAFDY